jgi:hypothetical protein
MTNITHKQLRALVAVASEVSLTREDALFFADRKKNSERARERHRWTQKNYRSRARLGRDRRGRIIHQIYSFSFNAEPSASSPTNQCQAR